MNYLFSEENKGNVRLEVFQLKMLIDNPNKIEKRLNFIEKCHPKMLVLSEINNKLTQIIPDPKHKDKFDCFELLDLQFGKEGEDSLG